MTWVSISRDPFDDFVPDYLLLITFLTVNLLNHIDFILEVFECELDGDLSGPGSAQIDDLTELVDFIRILHRYPSFYNILTCATWLFNYLRC